VDIERTIAAVWRIESAKLIAGIARITRDVGAAEELAQDALVTALEKWPVIGVPDNPGAWLMTTGKHRALDRIRHAKRVERKHEEMGRPVAERPDIEASLDDVVGDDMLRLVFTACHPVLSPEARVALALKVLGGLTTPEIARAFVVPEPTMAQRIVRAKRQLEGVPYELPRGEELAARLSSVLEVIYLIFNEGYAATAGDDWMRPALCDDALRLGRVVAELMPHEAEVHGLVALMEIQASRTKARVTASGEPITLPEQNRALWDRLLIRRGLAALARAEAVGGRPRGPYTLQAAIAACHARAPTADATDWRAIVAAYDELLAVMPSPIVELNRAVAVAMADGPAAGLALVDAIVEDGALATYHLLPAVRADFLKKLGRLEEARVDFERAAGLTKNARERELLRARAEACR
jgi:RNA polymerase sigma factor (sigma-70 family)